MTNKRLIFPLALLALLVVSCSKSVERRSREGGFDQSAAWAYDSADSFWDKEQGDGFTIDTTMDGDTTIKQLTL